MKIPTTTKIPCLLLAFATFLFLPAALTAQIVVENSDLNFDGDSGTATNTIPGFTVAAGDNRKLVLSINSETEATINSIEYGTGEFFQMAVDNGTNRLCQIWFLDDPSVSTEDIVITWSGNCRSRAGVLSLQNAAPGPPVVSNSAGGSVTSIGLTTTEADTFVVGCYNQNNGSGNPTGPGAFTNLYNGDSGSSNSDAGYVSEAVAEPKTYEWTTTTDGGAAVAGFLAFDPVRVYVMNSESNRDGDSGTPTNTISDFEVHEGAGRKLVVSINSETGGEVTSISYGTQSFTLAEASAFAGRIAQIWYLDDPAVGTDFIEAVFTANSRSQMGVLSLQNAAPGFPSVSASVGSGASSLELTTLEANTFVVGSYVQNGVANTVIEPFSANLYHGDSGSSWGIAAYQSEAAPGLKTYSYTNSDGTAGIAAAGFTALDPTRVYVVNRASSYDNDKDGDSNVIGDFEVAPGSNRKLVLVINSETAATIDYIEYGASEFVKAVDNETTRFAQIWYLDDPVVGTDTIVVVFSGSARSRMSVISLVNAAAGDPEVSSAVVGGVTSIDLTTTAANTFVLGSFIGNGNTPHTIIDPFATTLHHGDSGSSWGIAGYQNEAVAGLKTYAWENGADTGGIAIAGFVAPGSVVSPPGVLEITSFSVDPSGSTASVLSFTGEVSADYVLTSSGILSDGFPNTVTPTSASVGSLLGDVITTDGAGNASVEFTETGTVDFFRIESAP